MATFKIWLTTWNMNNRQPTATLVDQWFDDATGQGYNNRGAYDPDIIVVGVQEGNKDHVPSEYQDGTTASGYQVVDKVQLDGWAGGSYVGQYLTVLAKPHLLTNRSVAAVGQLARRQKTVSEKVEQEGSKKKKKVKKFQASTGNTLSRLFSQNKGGVATLIRVGRANIGFITLHIESKDGANTIRKGEVADLVNETRRVCHNATGADPHGLFIMGDFNYRLGADTPALTNRSLCEALCFNRPKLWSLDTFGKPGYYPFEDLDRTDGAWVFPPPHNPPGDTLWLPSYKWNKACPPIDLYHSSGTSARPPVKLGTGGFKYDETNELYKGPVNKAYRTFVEFDDKKPGMSANVKGNESRGGEYDIGWLDRIGYCLSLTDPIAGVDNVSFTPCNMRSADFLRASDHMAVCMRADLTVANPIQTRRRARAVGWQDMPDLGIEQVEIEEEQEDPFADF